MHEMYGGTLTGAKIDLKMFNSAPTAEDPGKVFRAPGTQQLGTTATYSYAANGSAPGLGAGGATSGVGEAVDIVMSAFQATVAIDLVYVFSVDLVWKT